MGEAKRRRQAEEHARAFANPIKRARFNLYTMGARHSKAAFMSEELSWWSSEKEDVLGVVARDTTDGDFLWMILVRDKIGRFRCASLQTDFRTQEFAERRLWVAMLEVVESGEIKEFGIQGDETNSPLDPFEVPADLPDERLHPYFKLMDSIKDFGRCFSGLR